MPLRLYDVDDTERFVGAIVSRSGLALSFHDREDLGEYLLVECWQLSLTYERGDPQYPPRFSVYATNILRRRLVDWQRQRFGRTVWKFKDRVHERPRPELVSLDGSERDRLVDALAEGDGDREADCDSPLRRLLRERDRARARDLLEMGLDPPRRAAD